MRLYNGVIVLISVHVKDVKICMRFIGVTRYIQEPLLILALDKCHM